MKHEGLPVHGYQPQSEERVALVNGFKIMEERMLRILDGMDGEAWIEQRWLAISRTHFEQGFMALNRSVFQPQRLKGELPDVPKLD